MASELQRLGEWEWRTEADRILLPSSHANEQCVRVRYRRVGDRVFRSFLLLGFDGEQPAETYIVGAIAEHSAR